MHSAAILDLFSRVVVGWAVSAFNDRDWRKAPDMALRLLYHTYAARQCG